MELRLGKMSGKEIAEWFGITVHTYQSKATKYLKKLEEFCEFEKVYGGVEISKIYLSTYDRKLSKTIDTSYVKEVYLNHGLTSMSGMCEKYGYSITQVRNSRNRLYGEKVYNEDNQDSKPGLLGVKDYAWVVKIYEGPNRYRGMTLEEQKYFDELIEEVYGALKVEEIKESEKIKQACKEEGVSIEEMDKRLEKKNLNFFNRVILRFRDECGVQLVCINDHKNLELVGPLTEEEQTYRTALLQEYNECAWEKNKVVRIKKRHYVKPKYDFS